MKRYWIQVQRDTSGDGWVSIKTLDYHPELLERLVALGLVEIENGMIHTRQSNRLDKIFRLRSCLGVNLTGAAIILDLLDKIDELKEKIRSQE
ncbi:MAG: chaperone modulator CbpM [Dethiobacter sp.]